MASQAAAFQPLTDDNHGSLVTLVSVSFLITAVIFTAAKVGSVIYFKQRRNAVNTPIWVALVLAIAGVVLMQKSVDYGLGRHVDNITVAAVHTSTKYSFAAQLIQILILSLSMLSTTLLVWKLTPKKGIRLACRITIGLTVAWFLFGLFATAFQCQMPEPWLYSPDRCVGKGALMYPIYILHILIETFIIVIPFFMMRGVQMAKDKRFKILASFSARSLVVGIAIARLALLPPYLRTSDPTWDLVYPAICGQAMMCTAIIVACLPTLYHIFAGLHSGLMTTRVPDGVELTRPSDSGYTKKYNLSGSRSRVSEKESRSRSRFSDTTTRFVNMGSSLVTAGFNNEGASPRGSSSEGGESTRRLTRDMNINGVMKTVDITVEVTGSSDGGGGYPTTHF